MSENTKTIGLSVLLFSVIFMSRTIDRTNAEPVLALKDRIALSSVPRTPSPEAFVAALSIPELSAIPSGPEPAELKTSSAKLPTSNIDPFISAIAGAVIDLDSGRILWERRPLQRHPLASLTKLMTSVIALEYIGADKHITIADDDVRAEGDTAGFKAGETFTVKDLIVAMLLASSNDAADAVARFYGAKPFVDAMQQKANELRLLNTSFFDSSGLSPLNQSTVEDLIVLVRYIRERHSEIFALSRNKERAIIEQRSGLARTVRSINAFAGALEFLGGKTGFTPEAHGNLISLFSDKGRTPLVIVLGTDDRFGETKLLYDLAKVR